MGGISKEAWRGLTPAASMRTGNAEDAVVAEQRSSTKRGRSGEKTHTRNYGKVDERAFMINQTSL